MTATTVFISRDLDNNSKLKHDLLSLNYKVIDQSLIKVTPIRFTHTPRCNWIFFNSKNAIKHFFAQTPVIGPGTRFGVMGKGSAMTLKGYGMHPTFIGTGNDSTSIARQFVKLVDSEIVLFPQAIDSLQTVQRWLPFNNIVRNLFVYKVEPKVDLKVPYCDILVFTSPSNVEAYFSQNKLHEHQIIFAIGTTTRLSLKSKGVSNAYIPKSSDEESLLGAIIEVAKLHSTQDHTIQMSSHLA